MNPSVLLVNPPYSSYQSPTLSYTDPQEPMGLLFLAGYLREQEINVGVIDFAHGPIQEVGEYHWLGASEAEIEAEFRLRQPRVVGISSMFSVHCHAVNRVAAAAKRAVPDTLVIVGGAHASAFPNIVCSDKNVDLAVIGEGEQTLYEIVTNRAQGRPVRGIAGTAYTDENGGFHREAKRKFLNLKAHPGPARDALDIERYIDTEYSRKHAMHPRRSVVVTSRGCPM